MADNLRNLLAQATPGPWEPWIEGQIFIDGEMAWGGDNRVTVSTNGKWLEIVRSRENIRLIALAPDAICLLIDMAAFLRGDYHPPTRAQGSALLARFAALDAKAGGQ